MNLIIYNEIPHYVFLYNFISHISLSISHYLKQTKFKSNGYPSILDITSETLFSLGHLFISAAQFIFFQQYVGSDENVTLFGGIGHLALIGYIITIFYEKNITPVMFYWFLIGQIGMVYFYLEHTDKNKEVFNLNKISIKNKHLFVITFITLFSYYIKKFMSISSDDVTKIPSLLVAGVYLGLTYFFSEINKK
tara:strand:- start:405 stop:983 length:579 start_codon:yes stop_codon:yes gene_type:complete